MISIASQSASGSKIEHRVVLGAATAVAVVALLAFTSTSARAEGVDAAALWAKNCKLCHGADGKKVNEKMGVKDLTSPEKKATLTRAKAIDSMKVGVKVGDKEVMKPYAEKLSAAEIEALADYTMALK